MGNWLVGNVVGVLLCRLVLVIPARSGYWYGKLGLSRVLVVARNRGMWYGRNWVTCRWW